MAFTFSERHITDYYHHGYTILRDILPVSLIADLRQVTDQGRKIARGLRGPQVQRLQPMAAYADQLDQKPFQDYAELPELLAAIQGVLTAEHFIAGPETLGILYEPAERPWCTVWHRDITEQSSYVDPEEIRRLSKDPAFFVQINCALYTDESLWYIPASGGRPDTPAEGRVARDQPNLEDVGDEEAERRCVEYGRAMPGAVRVILEPGDFMFYRPIGWHLGSYTPYRKRATLHDFIWNPESQSWHRNWRERMAKNQ